MLVRLLVRLRERIAPPEETDDGGSVWDLTPSWQYDGRLVEAGGATRSDQEDAIGDVQRRAAEVEDGTPRR